MNWSKKTIQDVVSAFTTNLNSGLSKEESKNRLHKFGPNVLPEKARDSWVRVFLRQFKSPLIYVLLIASVIIFFVAKDAFDAFVVSGVLLFNAIVGAIQEGRAQTILEGLKRFIKTKSVVLRDGKKEFIDNAQLVTGDVILLQEGERVPADARIVESNSLQVDEAVLTGESGAIQKIEEALEKDLPMTDQNNMVFKGTYVLSGSGKAVVTATGTDTEIGQMHKEAVAAIDTDMPLKKDIARLSRWILVFIFGMCVFLFGVGIATGKPITELLTTLTALFICVIPEGLPVVLTLVLVTGMYAMARRNVLVKRMQGVEALGRADVIIIDKTGTLTRNEMVVSQVATKNDRFDVSGVGYFSQGEVTRSGKKVDLTEEKNLAVLGIAGILLNSSELDFVPEMNLFDIKGSPTEIAISIFGKKLGLDEKKVEAEYEKVFEIPFDSRWQYHAVFHQRNGKGVAFISGVPEIILQFCSADGNTQKNLQNMLEQGLRVVAVATKSFDVSVAPENSNGPEKEAWFRNIVETESMTLLGLCGIQDSIRPEVADTIAQARDAGIRIIMATGDHKETAMFVARKVGIFCEGDCALEGSELEGLTDKQLKEKLSDTTVFARVTPQQKLKIVQELRSQGTIVAMTGDGVNDVPSLAAADLGIAMGKIGTEAAKQASDIVLLDDSFVSIMNAVEYGRHIFYTLRRVVLYFFSTNAGEVLVVLGSLLLGLPLPLTAVQILWLNLITDGFLDMALVAEKKEKGLLSPEVRTRLFRVVDWGVAGKMFFMAFPMAFFSLLIFSWYSAADLVHARSLALVTMAMFQWFNAFNCRSETKSIFTLGFFSNRWLLAAMALVFGLQIFVLHNSVMQQLFKTAPISFIQWCLVILVSSSIVFLEEARKWYVKKKKTA